MCRPQRWGAAAALSCLLTACAHPSRVTASVQGAPDGPPIARIAVGPAVGGVDEQVARALEHEGYGVVDSSATVTLLAAHHLDDTSLESREGLEALASERVDALLIAASAYPGWVLKSPKYVDVDVYPPERVAVRLVRTASGEVVTAFVWENGSCAMRGSPCDLRAKQSVYEAADQVANVVLHSIGPPPGHLIEYAQDDGTLVVSGVVFKKNGDCPGFAPGQRVRFTVGDPRGHCASAKLILIRSGEECDLVCPPVD